MASLIGTGTVSNPMTSDLLANGFNITGGATLQSVKSETQTLAVPAGSGLTEVVCEDNLLIQGDNGLLFGAPSLGTTSIKIEGDPGRDVIFGPVPAAVQTNVIGYNTATNKLTYFATPGSGSGVTGIAAGANITVDSTNPAVPIVSLSAPLTSALNVGTQDIITTTANADIDFTTNGTGAVHITKDTAGTALRVLNTVPGTAGAVSATPAYIELYKNRGTAPAVPPVAGDTIGQISAFGKDTANAKQEYTRITASIRDPTAGATRDGSLEFGCVTNNAYANYIQLNGNDVPAGEVNILKPLDLASGSTGLIKTSVAGGNINITSDTTGYVALNSASGQVQLNAGNSVVAKGANGVLLQTGAGTDRLKVLPTGVELASSTPLDTKGQTIKSTAGSLIVGDAGSDTRVFGTEVNMIAGSTNILNRFMGCVGVSGALNVYRKLYLYPGTGVVNGIEMSVESSPIENLRFTNMPIAPNSGICDAIGTGSVGQVITASGSGGWSWQTPATPPPDSLSAVLSAGNNAGGNSIDMNSNNLTNARNFSWGFAGGTTEYAGTTSSGPIGSAVGSIPIDIGGTTYYIPYYS